MVFLNDESIQFSLLTWSATTQVLQQSNAFSKLWDDNDHLYINSSIGVVLAFNSFKEVICHGRKYADHTLKILRTPFFQFSKFNVSIGVHSFSIGISRHCCRIRYHQLGVQRHSSAANVSLITSKKFSIVVILMQSLNDHCGMDE